MSQNYEVVIGLAACMLSINVLHAAATVGFSAPLMIVSEGASESLCVMVMTGLLGTDVTLNLTRTVGKSFF